MSIDVSGPSVSPAAMRCWVARERARRAKSCWNASPTSSGRSAPGVGGLQQLLERAVQVGAAVPERGAALEGQQVHRHRPALALVAERAIGRHEHVVEEDLAELLATVDRRDRVAR